MQQEYSIDDCNGEKVPHSPVPDCRDHIYIIQQQFSVAIGHTCSMYCLLYIVRILFSCAWFTLLQYICKSVQCTTNAQYSTLHLHLFI